MKHLQKIFLLLKAIGNQIIQWFLELPPYKRVVAVLGSLAIIFIAAKVLPSKKVEEVVADTPKGVMLASVSDLSNKSVAVPLVGQVTSVSEAVIRAESSGRLTKVYKKLGDRVAAGQVIAEFENSSERAAVLQAQGAYEAAKAARDIALINTANTSVGVNDTKTNTLNTINSSFATMDDIIRAKTDVAFTDPRTDSPRLKILLPDFVLQTKIENERKEIEKILVARFSKNMTLTTDSDLVSEIQKVQSEVQTIKNYLDDLSSAYVKAMPNEVNSQAMLDGQKAMVGVGRSTVSGTLTALTASKVALQNSLAGEEIAGRTTGDKNPNTASVDAQVKTAQGGYLAALSRLEKTIIRSPISGTLNSLTIDTGDFVSPTAQVAIVSNNGALEVMTYVTNEDLDEVKVGSKVKINSDSKGIVTRVAGAIDPVTKKIEVRIGITEGETKLINGQSVRVEISNNSTEKNNTKVVVNDLIKIPLASVKITPRESFVFTVDASNTLQAVPVVLGTLFGDEVEIRGGLDQGMIIVKDARGLKPGENVSIKN